MNARIFSFLLFTLITWSCSTQDGSNATSASKDPLPSWKNTEVKQNIIAFVEKVTDSSNASFVKPADRIATFDNDGTLWAEQPAYFQLFFAIEEVKAMADQHPEWKDQHPYKEVINNDFKKLADYGETGLLQLVLASHSGMDSEAFNNRVKTWINSAKHPSKNALFKDLVYLPMIELIRYLEENEFTVFIVSGGGVDFMRVFTQEVYGLPTHQIVGSSLKASFVQENGEFKIIKEGDIDFIDDKSGKPVGIHKHIGKTPIFACGNSDGDLQMLQYTSSNNLPNFEMFIHHTDSLREWKYDSLSHIGRLKEGLKEANKNNWAVVDMRHDWLTVFK